MNYTIIFAVVLLLVIIALMTINTEKESESKIAAGEWVIWHGHEFWVIERQGDWLIISNGLMHVHKVKVTEVTPID